jgi:hypothetical protein
MPTGRAGTALFIDLLGADKADEDSSERKRVRFAAPPQQIGPSLDLCSPDVAG